MELRLSELKTQSKAGYGRGTEREKRKMGRWGFSWDDCGSDSDTDKTDRKGISSGEKTSFHIAFGGRTLA